MIGSIATATFLAVFALLAAVFLGRAARRQSWRNNLRRRLGVHGGHAADALLRGDGGSDAARAGGLAGLAAQSGVTASTFVTRMLACAAGAALVGGLLGGAALAVIFAGVGAMVLPLLARRARAARLALCDQQMPQALEVMALALRAGHPLPGALAIAAAEAPAPLADELRRAVDEHELGRELGDVLLALGDRLAGGANVHTFVVAVLVLQQTGGNLIAVIERIVENARARQSYEQRLRALTAEGRSSAKMLALLPGAFAVLAAMADPSYATTLLSDPSGNVILAVTAALWAAGVLWTRHLVRTDA